MLLDHDIQGNSGSAGVFYEMTVLGSAIQSDWTTYSVTFDPTSATLPDGWIGRGDEDPNTFEPLLPNGATFADVLAGVDEFQLTGAVPGFFFGDAFFDIRIDNITVTTSMSSVPEPNAASIVMLTGLLGMCRRRTKNG